MTSQRCECEHPVFDVASGAFTEEEWDRCRRCGRTVSVFRRITERLDEEPHSVDVARRQELFDRLSPQSQLGSVDGRLVGALALAGAAVLLVVLFWQWVVGAGVVYGAYRHLTRGTRRRRPRSSWASNAKAVAAIYAAWNTRGFVQRNGRRLRVSVPAAAGREHVDQYGEVPF